MSCQPVSDRGDEYYTPKYVVEIILPYLKSKDIKTIWCPFDTEESEYVKVLKVNGYKVINTHIDLGQDFLNYEPNFEFDAVISNPPFSIKNDVFEKTIAFGKPWAYLMSATSIQSASLIRILKEEKEMYFVMFDRRISYDGDRPPFQSWYFTGGLLNKNEYYIYEDDPRTLFNEWESGKEQMTLKL